MKKIILTLILGLGLMLRVWGLDYVPPGFNADEASLGYNAYSLLKTGKDEWGESFPLNFKSFSDYKPGVYVYLVMPFVAVFGLTETSVRLPSIILGVLSILLIYFLAKEIFDKEIVALSGAFLLSISPWHIHFSRGGWETNIATFFILLGVVSFLWGLNYSKWFFISVISFILSMYSYQSTRLVVPAFVVFLAFAYRKQLFSNKIIAPAFFSLILLIPLALTVFSSKGYARFQGVSIFSDLGPINRINRERGEHENPNNLSSKLHHNKLISYSFNFIGNYLDHFTPKFLFISGDPIKRNNTVEMGQFHLFEILTILLGLYLLIVRDYKNKKIIFLWIIIAPIAAALTFQTPHALRAHNMVIPLTLISGFGLSELVLKIWKLNGYLRVTLAFVLTFVILFFTSKYLHQYFIHLPKKYALEWEYGFSKLTPKILETQDKYSKVVITTRYDQPYILLLFYMRYDPLKYQANPKVEGDNQFGFSTVTSFENFEFRRLTKDEINSSKNTLFVGTEEEIDNAGRVVDVLYFPNGEVAFKLVET